MRTWIFGNSAFLGDFHDNLLCMNGIVGGIGFVVFYDDGAGCIAMPQINPALNHSSLAKRVGNNGGNAIFVKIQSGAGYIFVILLNVLAGNP